MSEHLDFRTEKYRKGLVILGRGSIVTDIGLILSGNIRIEHTDLWGNKSILGIISTGEVFAESYACIPNEPMMVDAVANEDCDILFINIPRLFTPCSLCGSQNRLIHNLVMISAAKNLQLSRRILHTSSKTIRGRLSSYFSQQITAQGSQKIVIPFDRQQLADYLNLDRSALSKELGKMRNDGLIEYNKNTFTIKNPKDL
ncbi:MAG: Crp/Fnr family transcriptional regulator [Lachnospiraceae bacterium]|uniref:Crp/Fnr family transcriptional regulator n=1 Tax=Mediterraneibacter agrestimuris TaxID=2941333 RepID=UPI002040D466|nr:Crp/Fnr family transcriptional regulator [Mediterraneibacter agrestimuris]MDE6956713.1 Crp/Fnr family transcriptional regulator [Lachnospiraceae bacterium]